MTTIHRQVKTFRASSNEGVTEEINQWIQATHCIPITMTISISEDEFYAFVIYEAPAEKQRSLGLR